jgi:hypothetical protein
MSEELETRFASVARGRVVSVTFEPKDFILARDFTVAFQPETSTFEVVLRRGGCFEGAYRCIQRWIEAKAEQLDGINSVPPGHLDLRSAMAYWMLEKNYEQFRSDLEAAVAEKVSWLERVRPSEGVVGEVTIEARVRSLAGFLDNLERVDVEVRRGVHSPETIKFCKTIEIDVYADAR